MRLQSMLSAYPHIYQFLDADFIRKQYRSGLKNQLLQRLENEKSSIDANRHLPTLEKRLAELDSIAGYGRLKPRLQGASDWDEYQEFLAQIDITLWFWQKNLLKEIEPELPHRDGYADMLLYYLQQDIYCEVTSFQSIAKSLKSRVGEKWDRLKTIKGVVRNLLDKTRNQLPEDYPGILALDTTKSGIFSFDVREIAQKLFPSRPQVALIMLWSWEGTEEDFSWDMSPSAFYINGDERSIFRVVGEKLLECSGLGGEVVGL